MYTVDTPYEQEVLHLKESLERFGLDYKLYPIKSERIWAKNTQKKAPVLLEALEEFETDIVWLDADAVVIKRPELFETLDCDFAAVIREKQKSPKLRLLSGTMFLKNREIVKNLLEAWKDLNETNFAWDQENLYQTIQATDNLKVISLPAEYAKMRPFSYKGPPRNGVIFHNQRSRQVRSGKWKI